MSMFEKNLDYLLAHASASTIAIAIICSYILYVGPVRIRKAYFTPLYQIPGPWYSGLTSRPLKWAILTGKRCHYVQSLHKKYGPIVRIGPSEIAFADAASSKEIHGAGSRYLKVPLPVYAPPMIFSMTDPKEHNIRRRLYAKLLSQASLREHFEPAVRHKIRLAVSKIREDARNGTADVAKWWMFMALDAIALLTIGDGPGMLEKGGKDLGLLFAEQLHKGIAVKEFSSLLYYVGLALSLVSCKLYNIFLFGLSLLEYGKKAAKAARSKSNTGAGRTFFARVLDKSEADNAQTAKARAELTDEEICFDAVGFKGAGSDTVAMTLTYIVWCVLSRPALQKQLEEEVAGIVGEVTDATCEKLPLLNAVIDETLRLHGAAPTALRRRTPRGGATLGGYRIPEGTIVTTQAWSLHRNPDIWKNPETFDPYRWLSGDQAAGKGTDTFAPFSAGPRICGGVHLARMELRIATAMFFMECPGAKLKASATPESMFEVDRFNTHPVGRRLEITL